MPPLREEVGSVGREWVVAETATFARLYDVAVDYLHEGDLPRLLSAALVEALAVAGAERGCVQIMEGEGGGLRLAAHQGLSRPFLDHVASLRTGLVSVASREGDGPLYIEDVTTYPALAGSPDREALLSADVRALLVTPMRCSEGSVVGLLSTLHRDAPRLRDGGLRTLERIAALCAGGVVRAHPARPRRELAGDQLIVERLHQMEELFRNTVENMPVDMVLCDRDARVLYLSPALAATVAAAGNLAPHEIPGRHGAEVWPAPAWQPLHAHVQRAIATGLRQSYEVATTMPGGEPAARQWTVVPLAGAAGQVHRVLAISHDVTAQRRLVDELREADRRKGEFIGLLSHELRNPLAAIRSGLYVLESADDVTGEGRERRATARSVIDRQMGHLVRMVDELLDVTRISRNKIHLRREPLDLVRLVREAIDDNRAQLESRGVRLHAELTEAPLIVAADAVRIAQVVTNLLSNAAKFTSAGGCATVSVFAEGSDAVVRVADTGCGIEPGLLPHVFESFMQAERTLDRASGGLGLGLALVKGLVELHGGRVRATSPGSGLGATFEVRLPIHGTEAL
jgi:PAS domain S-box-containing protein